MSEAPGARIRFGHYEVDLAAGELLKKGQTVRLQEQPFQVLAALVNRPGEVVTREELRERLWPSDSFGDFDQGLNTAINKLREALGDSAANPRFVETLPKRGYRFTHPIETERVEPAEGTTPVEPRMQARRRLLSAVVAICALTAAVLIIVLIRRPAAGPQLPLRRYTIPLPAPIATAPYVPLLAVSPNGKHIAFIAVDGSSKLWIQDLAQDKPRAVEGSDGAAAPFWSPDSSAIAFGQNGQLKRVSVNGGPIISVCDTAAMFIGGGSWSSDSRSIVFSAGSPAALYTVPSSGGTASLLLSPEMLEQRRGGASTANYPDWIIQPNFLPPERGVLSLVFSYSGSLWVINLPTGAIQIIGPGSNPFYSSSGYLLYRSGTDLWGRPFSVKHLRFDGEAVRVARDATDPSVASDGTLVYREWAREQLVWLDRRGARVGTVGQPADRIFYPALSPNDRQVAAEIIENFNPDVWVFDILRGARVRLSSHPATDVLPVWAPGGGEVAFSSYRGGNTDIFVRRADAGSDEKVLAATSHNERVSAWSKDGQYILYSLAHPTNGSDLWYLKRGEDGKWEPRPLLQTSFDELVPKFSPDGRYVAYLSNQSGRREAYVRQFLWGNRTWPVSTRGASQLQWSRDGRELFFLEAGALIAVSVSTTPEFAVGQATRLFSHAAFDASNEPNYDVSADRQRILIPERVGEQERAVHVVQNWLAEFKEGR
jgi:Tol biopolymer transport system component/DNA-binding winged helix-turn-helix (wHTH) protein